MGQGEGKISKKYARALFETCEVSELEAVRSALSKIVEIFTSHQGLQQALANPAISMQERGLIMSDTVSLQESDSQNFSSSWKGYQNFFQILLSNSRLYLLESIANEFSLLVDELKKNLALEITSAFELSDSEKDEISKRIESEVGTLSSVNWQKDESLIGGLVVRAGDKVFDNSVKGTLARLKSELCS